MKSIDHDIVKKLIDYSNDIANMYDKLYELDINGQKNSELYYDIVGFIEERRIKEQNIYDQIPEKYLEKYYNYFYTLEKHVDNININTQKKLFEEEKFYIINRIVNTLDNMVYECQSNPLENEDYDDEFELFSINHFMNYSKDIKEFDNHVLNTAIIFLDDLIENKPYNKLKEYFKKTKYKNSYFHKEVEDIYLLFGFNLNLDLVNRDNYINIPHIIMNAYSNCTKLIRALIEEGSNDDLENYTFSLITLKAYLYFLQENNIKTLITNTKKLNNPIKNKMQVIKEMNDVLKKVSN